MHESLKTIYLYSLFALTPSEFYQAFTTIGYITFRKLYGPQFTLLISLISHTKTFLNDLLCRTLHFATLLNISYDSSTLPLPKHIGLQHAIHDKFITDPKLYALQIPLLKRMNIQLYAQCIDPSDTHFLPFQKIIELYASHLKISRPPKWYTFLWKLVTADSDSITALTLQTGFCIPANDALNRTQTSSVTSHQFSPGDLKKMWLATILSPEDITFGHLNAIQTQDQQLIVTHWVPTLSFIEWPTTIQICRPHNLRLTLCSGYSLNNTHVGSLHRKIHPNRKKTWLCVFICPKTDAIQISDEPRNSANNIA